MKSDNKIQRVIATADDYGMCDAVDSAINAGILNGIITSTNVIVNMCSLYNSKTLRAKYPDLSIGIHWNVTTGKPVCKVDDVHSLVNEKGDFWGVGEFKKRFAKGLVLIPDLKRELEAQYDLFVENCGEPDYWNTHENSALQVKAFKVFSSVAHRHRIPATRTFQRVYYDKVNLGLKKELREIAVRIFFDIWFSQIRKEFKMPTARVVSFDKISKLEGDYLLNGILNDGRDLIEVVFHPALSAESSFFGNITTKRIDEYRFVSSPEIKQRYFDKGIRFVGFSEL